MIYKIFSYTLHFQSKIDYRHLVGGHYYPKLFGVIWSTSKWNGSKILDFFAYVYALKVKILCPNN